MNLSTARRWLPVLALLLALPVSAQDRLRIHGSNTIGERLAVELAQRWLAESGYTQIEVREIAFEEKEIIGTRDGNSLVVEIHAHGSSTSFTDLLDGTADVGMSSRPIRPGEVAAGRTAGLGTLDAPQQEIVLALDGLSVIVAPGNPVNSLSKDQVRRIFAGQIRDWAEIGRSGGRIAMHARDDKSGTFDTFKTLVLESSPLSADARRYESTDELAANVARDPDAIGFVGLSGVRGVRALAIADGGVAVPPTREEVAVEDYPLSRRLYLYLPEKATPLAREFASFSLSAAGQDIAEATGFISQNIRSYAFKPRSDTPEEYRQLIDGAERLSLNFRFGSSSSLIDGKTLRDLDRLAEFMRRAENRGRPLLLLGFADASEVIPYMAIALSNDRVDYISDLLNARGVAASRLRGMGGSAAVASNESPIGRQRNRRVEVWIGGSGASFADSGRGGVGR